jgi:hypothetical protein
MGCIPVLPEYLLERGWSYKLLADEVGRLDHEECPEYQFDAIRCAESIADERKIWFFLYDEDLNKIAGFLDYRALDEEKHSKVINGTFKDGELGSNIPKIEGEVNLYVSGFIISKVYQKDYSNFKKLLVIFTESIIVLVNKGLVIKDITARGLTPMGQRLCEGIGMKKIMPHRDKGIIYRIELENLSDNSSSEITLFEAIQDSKAKRVVNYLQNLSGK